MNAAAILALLDNGIKAASGAAEIIDAATQGFAQAKSDMAITDVQAIQSRLADAHALTLRMSKTLDDKLAAAERQ